MAFIDQLWEFLGPIALASDYPTSQEGPNEVGPILILSRFARCPLKKRKFQMDLAWLPGEKTILAMVRLEYEACILCAGVDWR